MEIVEYIDENTGKPSGKYAKRHVYFVDVPEKVDVIDEVTGNKSIKTVIRKERRFKDEIIPKKCFCVCDSVGNIKSITEVNFSYWIEVEGRDHCMELKEGEECHRIMDSDMPVIPTEHENDKLKWILENHKMGKKDKSGIRKLEKR